MQRQSVCLTQTRGLEEVCSLCGGIECFEEEEWELFSKDVSVLDAKGVIKM